MSRTPHRLSQLASSVSTALTGVVQTKSAAAIATGYATKVLYDPNDYMRAIIVELARLVSEAPVGTWACLSQLTAYSLVHAFSLILSMIGMATALYGFSAIQLMNATEQRRLKCLQQRRGKRPAERSTPPRSAKARLS